MYASVQARQVADTRRTLMSLFSGKHAHNVSLSMMGVGVGETTESQDHFADVISSTHGASLAAATLYLADSSMCTLLDIAGPTMPDQVLLYNDLLTDHGFVIFAKPLIDLTGQGVTLPIQALLWSRIPDCHPLLVAGISGSETLKPAGTSVMVTAFITTHDLADTVGVAFPIDFSRLMPNASVVWAFGTGMGNAYGDNRAPDVNSVSFYQRLLAAFWTLCRQPLTSTVSDSPPTRPDRARYQRAGIDHPGQEVRVVMLRPRRREAVSPGSTGSRKQVSVQFMVRGYWRQTWYASMNENRQQWIAPHMKGPNDGPLLHGEKVFLAQGSPPPKN